MEPNRDSMQKPIGGLSASFFSNFNEHIWSLSFSLANSCAYSLTPALCKHSILERSKSSNGLPQPAQGYFQQFIHRVPNFSCCACSVYCEKNSSLKIVCCCSTSLKQNWRQRPSAMPREEQHGKNNCCCSTNLKLSQPSLFRSMPREEHHGKTACCSNNLKSKRREVSYAFFDNSPQRANCKKAKKNTSESNRQRKQPNRGQNRLLA